MTAGVHRTVPVMQPMHRRRYPHGRRPAFSLVELMIAIMILGLGMVMVATVFPVSLDVTRDVLQIQISNNAVAAAVATLELRVPRAHETMDQTTGLAMRVLLPDMDIIQLKDTPTPASITGLEFYALYRNPASTTANTPFAFAPNTPLSLQWGDYSWNSIQAYNSALPSSIFWSSLSSYNATEQDMLTRSRNYSEWTFWDAEQVGNYLNGTWVVASENLGAGKVNGVNPVVIERPPYIVLPSSNSPRTVPAIDIADRVYPPIEVSVNANGVYQNPQRWNKDNGDYEVFANDAEMRAYVAQEIVDRQTRYSWTAIHHKALNLDVSNAQTAFETKPAFLCTIVVTHRGDTSSRYARQLDQGSINDGQFDLGNSIAGQSVASAADADSLGLPEPDLAGYDTLFPQAWLVALTDFSPADGAVACRAAVARLLPRDSYFVIAQAPPTGLNAASVAPGTAYKVIGSNYKETMGSGDEVVLKVPRGSGGPYGPVAAWVFPPAILSRSPLRFANRTPTVAVTVREVQPQ